MQTPEGKRVPAAEQQQGLRETLQRVPDQEKLADAHLQIDAMEKGLARERLERQHAADSAAIRLAELKETLTVGEEALKKIDGLRRSDRRVVLSLIPGLLLAMALVFVFQKYGPQPAEVMGRKRPRSEVSAPVAQIQSPDEQGPETAAVQRLDRALAPFAPAVLPGALEAADRLLVSSGQKPCSVIWATGEPAFLVNAGRATKAPLLETATRCASALEQIAVPTVKQKPK